MLNEEDLPDDRITCNILLYKIFRAFWGGFGEDSQQKRL